MGESVAVDRYIELRRSALQGADAIRNELAKLQEYMPSNQWDAFRKIESILDGLSSSPR